MLANKIFDRCFRLTSRLHGHGLSV